MTSPRRILARLGLKPHKGRGQNFLVDPNLARKIVGRAGLSPGGLVVEVGPGLGALTRPLLEAGFPVVAVEVDPGLVRYLEEELRPLFPGRLRIIEADILKVDLAGLRGPEEAGLSVVGNLPYQISTPLLLRLLEARAEVVRAALMFQRELAERLLAGPGTKAYGRLSVLLAYFARVERLLDLGPEAFHPRPQVGSTLLGLSFKETPQPPLRSEALFRRVIQAGFAKRRKTLRNALAAAFPQGRVEAALAAAGVDPGRRAETLAVEEFVALANTPALAQGGSAEEPRGGQGPLRDRE